ncbi:MAG: hypothetical protein ABGX16_25895, partial [Pirellulales bacterium]
MRLNQKTDTVIALILLFLFSLVATNGCRKQPIDNLPAEQALAVKALQALGVIVSIRDDDVKLIDFYTCQDTAAGISHLKPFVELKKINFSSTGITDDELPHLKHLVNLEELTLNNTQVTDAGLK